MRSQRWRDGKAPDTPRVQGDGGCGHEAGTLAAESHRNGRNEEVPGKERAQAQDKEADPDQVVAVGISQKVTLRTQRLSRAPAPRLPGRPLRRADYNPHHSGSGSRRRRLMGIVVPPSQL